MKRNLFLLSTAFAIFAIGCKGGETTDNTAPQNAPTAGNGPATGAATPGADAAQNAPGATTASLTYEGRIKPIMDAKCINCHGVKGMKGGIDLRTYATMVKGGEHGPGITPKDPSKSSVLLFIKGEKKPQMPMGQPPLPAEDQKAIEDWINAGAPEK